MSSSSICQSITEILVITTNMENSFFHKFDIITEIISNFGNDF